MDLQHSVAAIAIALITIGLTAVLSYQVIMHIPLDATLTATWGVAVGQYVRLLGVEQGVKIAVNGTTSERKV